MPRDHFVAQTYLRSFGDPTRDGQLHAYRKDGGTPFPVGPHNICKEWDGDLNPKFLSNPNLLGEFRALFEGHWSPAVEELSARKDSWNTKLAIAGYAASMLTTTPAWRRVMVDMTSRQIESRLRFQKAMKDKHGGFEELPDEAIEALKAGRIKLQTNEDYVKAVVTRDMIDYLIEIINQDWIILHNKTDTRFLTSDNPVAIREVGDLEPNMRVLPITPRLCLAFMVTRRMRPPDDREAVNTIMQTPPKGRVSHIDATPAQVRDINCDVVKCAEQFVFSSQSLPSLVSLVTKYARFRVCVDYLEVPSQHEDALHQSVICRVRDKDVPLPPSREMIERIKAYSARTDRGSGSGA